MNRRTAAVLLLCLCMTTQPMACGSNSAEDVYKVSLSRLDADADAEYCISLKMEYPKNFEAETIVSVKIYTGIGMNAFLSINFADDFAYSYFCLNEDILSKSKVLFTFSPPLDDMKNFCLPKSVKIDHLDKLLAISDKEILDREE